MSKVALAFFTVAPLYGLVGMLWGIQMGASEDHTMMPAHAHLNLLGLVLNGVFGAFYATVGSHVSPKLAWPNFFLSNIAIVVMIPVLAMILSGDSSIAPLIVLGEVLAVLGMASFLLSVIVAWKTKTA